MKLQFSRPRCRGDRLVTGGVGPGTRTSVKHPVNFNLLGGVCGLFGRDRVSPCMLSATSYRVSPGHPVPFSKGLW